MAFVPHCRVCDSADLHPAGDVDGFSFVECARCRFVFAPDVTRMKMERLYRSGYHGPEDGAPEEGWADPTFLQPAFDIIGRTSPLRILDFGTGQSRVPDQLRGEGHRVIAVDIAPPIREHPDRLTGSLDALRLESDQFDLVYAFQVFEHLPEPRPTVLELLRLTRPGGLVLIHTDMEMPERETAFADWWYVTPPDHCSFYRNRTFEVLLRDRAHRLVRREPKCVVIEAGS